MSFVHGLLTMVILGDPGHEQERAEDDHGEQPMHEGHGGCVLPAALLAVRGGAAVVAHANHPGQRTESAASAVRVSDQASPQPPQSCVCTSGWRRLPAQYSP